MQCCDMFTMWGFACDVGIAVSLHNNVKLKFYSVRLWSVDDATGATGSLQSLKSLRVARVGRTDR